MPFDTTLPTRLKAHLTPTEAVADFWRALGHAIRFGKDPDFDRRFRDTFAAEHEAAARGEVMPWLASPTGALSLILLLDQYPRNAFRGLPRMYATDAFARTIADQALRLGHDQATEPMLRPFFYLPFGHSEGVADQERSVALCSSLPEPVPTHARGHRDIIARFGRFPHRNAIVGRLSTAEEICGLAAGGFQG